MIRTEASGIAWNGSIWVAVGNSGTGVSPSIVYTTNAAGTSGWTAAASNPFSRRAYDVAWNGSIFVVVGRGSTNVATSTDGINWTSRGAPGGSRLLSVSWNGSIFIAAGGTTNYIVTSTDGITWSTPTTPLTNYGRGVGTSPAPNLYPPI